MNRKERERKSVREKIHSCRQIEKVTMVRKVLYTRALLWFASMNPFNGRFWHQWFALYKSWFEWLQNVTYWLNTRSMSIRIETVFASQSIDIFEPIHWSPCDINVNIFPINVEYLFAPSTVSMWTVQNSQVKNCFQVKPSIANIVLLTFIRFNVHWQKSPVMWK